MNSSVIFLYIDDFSRKIPLTAFLAIGSGPENRFHFQAIMQPKAAFVVSVARGLVISGGLILILPVVASPEMIWWAMPVTEAVVAGYVVVEMKRNRG